MMKTEFIEAVVHYNWFAVIVALRGSAFMHIPAILAQCFLHFRNKTLMSLDNTNDLFLFNWNWWYRLHTAKKLSKINSPLYVCQAHILELSNLQSP